MNYQFGSFALDDSTGVLYMIRSLFSADRLAGFNHSIIKSVVNPPGSIIPYSWTEYVSHEDSAKLRKGGKGFGILRGLAIDSRCVCSK